MAALMFECVCGYVAVDEFDLTDHIGYMNSVDDPDEHGQRP